MKHSKIVSIKIPEGNAQKLSISGVDIWGIVTGLATSSIVFDDASKQIYYTNLLTIWEQSNIASKVTFTIEKANSTSNNHNFSSATTQYVRLYKNSKGTVSCDKPIKELQFLCYTTSYATTLGESIEGSEDTPAGTDVTVFGAVVTVKFTDTVDSLTFTCVSQIRIGSINITH